MRIGAFTREIIQRCGLLLLPALLWACGSNSTPLDPETRIKIDSMVMAQTTQAQKDLDSMWKAAEKTRMPALIDSIKKERKREIEQQLRSVPR